MTVNADGTFSYTPDPDFNGSDSFTFKANDGAADSNVATIMLTINPVDDPVDPDNAAPVAQDGSASGDEDTVINGTLAASDIDSASLTFSRVTNASHGNVTVNADGTFSYTPNRDFNGSDSFTFKANDGALDSNVATVSLTIAPVEEPPVGPVNWTKSVEAGVHPGVLIRSLVPWSPQEVGDFNGDGTSDILWHHPPTNAIDIWKIGNGQWAGSAGLDGRPPSHQPAGFGDYNSDGTSDILWFNPATRHVDLWKVLNGQWAGSVDIGTHPAGWTPALSGDFNGDGTTTSPGTTRRPTGSTSGRS